MAEIAEREAREEAERAKSKARDNLLYDLTDISGIDDKLARTLLDQFPDRQSIQDASAEELTDIPGLGSSKAKAIKARIG